MNWRSSRSCDRLVPWDLAAHTLGQLLISVGTSVLYSARSDDHMEYEQQY
jgi:hypothetical protein